VQETSGFFQSKSQQTMFRVSTNMFNWFVCYLMVLYQLQRLYNMGSSGCETYGKKLWQEH